MTGLILVSLLTQAELEPPPDPAAIDLLSNGTVCFKVEDLGVPRRTICQPPPSGWGPVTAAVEEGIVAATEPGSRWGAVTLAGAIVGFGLVRTSPPLSEIQTSARATGVSGIAGIGFRYGLKPRGFFQMLMPGISFVAGSSFTAKELSPFVESRLELMSVSPGGALQPNVILYGTSGLGTTPLGRRPSWSLQPHVGIGFGWNWLPKVDGGVAAWLGGDRLLLLPVLAAIGFLFVGRVEVRYTAKPISGPGDDSLGLIVGFGS